MRGRRVIHRPVFYTESDGQPIAETGTHRRQLLDLLFALEMFFQSAPEVYVAGNLMFYYVEGDPGQCVAPDVFVVRGVPKGDRRVYKVGGRQSADGRRTSCYARRPKRRHGRNKKLKRARRPKKKSRGCASAPLLRVVNLMRFTRAHHAIPNTQSPAPITLF
jgi:hypothetical protein